MASLVSITRAVISERLQKDGFVRKGELSVRAMEFDFDATVGLVVSPPRSGNPLQVNPVIGIRATEVERFVSRHLEAIDKYRPTILTNLGFELTGDWSTVWCSRDEEELGAMAESIAQAVATAGEKFWVGHAGLDGILEGLTANLSPLPDRRLMQMVATFTLLGRVPEAIRHLQDGLDRLASRTDPGADEVRTFAKRYFADNKL